MANRPRYKTTFIFFPGPVLSVALACSPAFASPPDDQSSRAEAQSDAQLLIDSVESHYDCKFSLDYLIVGLELNTSQYTVVVQRAGNECDEALRALQLRSLAFPVDFIELGSFDELPGQESTGQCSPPCAYEFPAWGDTGYPGFVKSIDITAGDGAKNCGFFDRRNPGREADFREDGFRCALHSYRNGTPFKFGTVRLPEDSYAWEILVRSSKGENWLIVYDIMIDGTAPQIWLKKCDTIRFQRDHSSYEGRNCTEYDGSNDPLWNTT